MDHLPPWLDYSLLKTVHIISATLLYGTGLGTYFFMIRASRSDNVQALRVTTATVVLADWLFTTPAVIVQFVTGLLLMERLGISYSSPWFLTVMALFVFVGALWLPVVWIQIVLRNLLRELPAGAPLPARFRRLVRIWEGLGYPAFASGVGVFALMVYKPWIA
ncbi:hypothetical protein SF06_34780 [Pseudomonas flexibilis]|uniref:Uncharacterized membrane protein n=1 Tax=Pseudomonas flexibilis TaxID=706570 RepID=A0A1N7AHV8_9PSED|nr:DUF2269 domain-containing protein [Pseudomonas flexibilis]KHL67751.1 hypothetical protein SF06_34780 [Pseudomonas flexibilis]SIR38553.1 Uncharacterized membrane protein [Pseudomonas flexibilis]